MLLLVREKTSRFATVRVRAVIFVFFEDVADHVSDVEDHIVEEHVAEDHVEDGLDGWVLLVSREKISRFATIRASMSFLGPRGPLVLPSVGLFVRPVHPSRKKNLDHLYTGIYAS